MEFQLEKRIKNFSPLLDAFGNAETTNDTNSARYGKYLRLFIDSSNHKIIGGQLVNYLLEKSRITNLLPNERNYHIFYYLLNADQETLSKL